jgi:FlaA1/EpsC-like NDP-sugar epimerase
MGECLAELTAPELASSPSMWPMSSTPAAKQWNLKRLLVAGDAWAVLMSWGAVLGLRGPTGAFVPQLGTVAAIGLLTLMLLKSQQLYRARISRLRSEELSRLVRVSLLVGTAVYLAAGRMPLQLGATDAAVGAIASFGLLACFRSAYASWLSGRRSQGLYSQPVVVVGRNEEGTQLRQLLTRHPELGLRPVATTDIVDDVIPTLSRHGASSVVVAVSALAKADLNRLTRLLLHQEVHVHLSCGLAGIDYRRLRPSARHDVDVAAGGQPHTRHHRLARRSRLEPAGPCRRRRGN